MCHFIQVILNIRLREECRTDLLCDTSCFTGLDLCFPQFVKDQCLTSVYVTHNTDDWTTKLSILVFIPPVQQLFLFLFLKEFLLSFTSFCVNLLQSVLFHLFRFLLSLLFLRFLQILDLFTNFPFRFFLAIIRGILLICAFDWDFNIF